MDGRKAFAHLCDAIPEWTERLKALAFTVNERHLEFTRLSRTASGASSLHRKRTGSTESLRPDDETPPPDASPNRSGFPTSPARVEINPDAKRLFQEYRQQAKRKRTSGSIISNSTGTPRSRMSIIVYYDSAIQDGFEFMVRSIASARNTLRKGKTAASVKSRMMGMAMEESPFDGNRSSFSMRDPKIPRLTRSSDSGDAYNAAAFDQIDKELESAQTLCEIGAHQFLRDGNCQTEIAGAHERIDGILATAREQRALYEEEEKAEAAVGQGNPRADAQQASMNRIFELTNAVDVLAADNNANGILEVDGDDHPDHSIAVDSALDIDPDFANEVGLAVDPDFANEVGLAVDPDFDGNSSAPMDSDMGMDFIRSHSKPHRGKVEKDSLAANDSGIAVDPSYDEPADEANHDKLHGIPIVQNNLVNKQDAAPSYGAALANGAIAIDSNPLYGTDSKDATLHYSTGPIEVDDQDATSIHIDLTSFRRTRAM